MAPSAFFLEEAALALELAFLSNLLWPDLFFLDFILLAMQKTTTAIIRMRRTPMTTQAQAARPVFSMKEIVNLVLAEPTELEQVIVKV